MPQVQEAPNAGVFGRVHRAVAGLGGFIRRHPDLVALVLILAIAAGLRFAFTFRTPVFVTKDSYEYVQPGYSLAAGQGFELAQRRTPVYPAFIAGVVVLVGQELGAIAFVQHLVGIATVALVYVLGRITVGRAVAVAAAGLFALSSPQLIYEHYVITEPVFTFLLVGSVLLLVLAARRQVWWLFVLAGLALGLAALTRPVAQVLLPFVPIYLYLVSRSWRRAAGQSAIVLGCVAALLIPWTIRNQQTYGTPSTTGVGRFLISRSVKHERNFVFYDEREPRRPDESPTRLRARQIAQDVTSKRPAPGQVYQRVRDELGLTEPQTDALLRDIALEAIRKNPGLYAEGTFEMLAELWLGARKEETLRWHLDEHDQPRVANQWGPMARLLRAPSPAELRELPSADRLSQIFRPTWIMGLLAPLFLIGCAASLLRPAWRLALWPGIVTAVHLASSTALVGEVPRYRYPVDPFIFLIAGLGALGALLLVHRVAGSLRGAVIVGRRPALSTSLDVDR